MIDIENILLKATEYHDLEPNEGKKIISASSFSSSPLQRALRARYGVQEQKHIEVNTIGSLLHLAIQDLLKDKDEISCEYRLETKLENGWTLTGRADVIDWQDNVVIDIKNVKRYAVDKLKDSMYDFNINSPYILQLNAYRYMLEKKFDTSFDMKIWSFSCDGDNADKGWVFEEIPIIFADIEAKINMLIDDTEWALEILDLPAKEKKDIKTNKVKSPNGEKLCDTWLRRGQVPMRCAKYCGYKEVCPFYHEKPKFTADW